MKFVPPESDHAATRTGVDSLDDDRSVLDSRAEQLAQRLAEEPLESEFLELLTFDSGSDRLAIETRFVCEVLRDVVVTPLPGQNGPLVGITNLRGEVVAIMSLIPLLNAASSEQPSMDERGGCRWVIVIGAEHAQFGLVVSDVTEVVGISNSEVLDPSRQTRISDSTLTRGVTNDARIILDGAALLIDPEFVIEDRN